MTLQPSQWTSTKKIHIIIYINKDIINFLFCYNGAILHHNMIFSFQGVFVSLIFCFFNGEVRGACNTKNNLTDTHHREGQEEGQGQVEELTKATVQNGVNECIPCSGVKGNITITLHGCLCHSHQCLYAIILVDYHDWLDILPYINCTLCFIVAWLHGMFVHQTVDPGQR